MNKEPVKMCITSCPRGFRICCGQCWIIDCQDDCGKDVYENCQLMKGGTNDEKQ